jgi:outer membrane protein insertion porin family
MAIAKVGPARRRILRVGPLLFAGFLGGAFGSGPALVGVAQQPEPAHASIVPATDASLPDASQAAGKSGRPEGMGSSGNDLNDNPSSKDRLSLWEGKPVLRIEFVGVAASRLAPLPDQIAQQPGTPLKGDSVRQSLRRLYATGLYDSISVDGRPEGNGVVLIFRGQARTFIGTVTVEGAKGSNINSLLVRTSRLSPGTRFTPGSLTVAETEMKHSLAENGFHEPSFSHTLTPHPEDQLVDIAYKVVSGPQARTGAVAVAGESGLTEDEFRHYSKLKLGRKVDRETTSNALDGVVKHYRKEQRLEAEVKLQSQDYVPAQKTVDFHFSANRGPIVHVLVDGVSLSQGRVKRLVPVYEEGTVDEDLLNEGNRHLQNYYQRLGYFDVKVQHEQKPPTADLVEIIFHVQRGARHRVRKVLLSGAKYFDLPTLEERLSVLPHDAFDRQGIYNQSLVAADVGSLQAIYRNNGFSNVKVTPEIHDADSPDAAKRGQTHVVRKYVELDVIYHIDEGQQQKVHSVQLQGTEKLPSEALAAMLNTAAGQPLSPESLAGDRDTLVTYYLSKGFEQAQVELTQAQQPNDPAQVDITFHIREGEQVFLRRVLISGLHYTRPSTIAHGLTLKEGEPLDQSALLGTQRKLYDLSLFNEVNPVIQNPTGEEPRKTVLLQMTEARRWDLSYGLGFEVQTGTVNGSTQSNPNGTTGASPRVLLEVSRINLFGREQSASIRGTYGLLEQRINLLYQYPHIRGNHNFGISFSGGYNNSQDITTYSASKLEASVRLTEHFSGEHQLLSKANTFVYQFIFRRVKVDQGSAQIPQNEIPLLFQAVRVGGPSFNWIRDTRDAPLDAHRGTYTSFQEFIASSKFGSEANFNQVDVSNSSYYQLHKDKIIVARNTRYGQERVFGAPSEELIPLPERLYGGGGNSHRGFGINSAGPRDPQTGFPIGGAGVFINTTELRLPPPTLPYVGKTISFVPFHDMGNVFTNASDIWPSFLRFRQENREGCRNLTPGSPTGPVTSTGQQGTCTFNYFSHALGVGLRYRTPVGPVRVDFSYNLNPPIYPVTYDAVNQVNLAKPYVGEGAHFNFFFSLGQSF